MAITFPDVPSTHPFAAAIQEMADYLMHWPWAGAIISSPGLDDLPVLLNRDMQHGAYAVVDYGTGLSYEDWIAKGAPPDIAAFLAGEPGD